MVPSRSTMLAIFGVVLAVFLALGGCSSSSPDAADRHETGPAEDLVMHDGDFVNLHDMTPVRGFFVANRLGHLRQTLAVANNPKGGTYPVGTVLQLVPQEAMVKRRAGFSPQTHDWEFFFLTTDAHGTTIVHRGRKEVVNRFGGNCFSCHAAAGRKFDLVCEQDHGCAPIGVSDDIIRGIQATDPRPRAGTTTTTTPKA